MAAVEIENGTDEITEVHVQDALDWFRKSTEALISLYNPKGKTFLRNTESSNDQFYSSATLHALISLSNSVLVSDSYDANTHKVKAPYFNAKCNHALELETLLNQLTSFGNGKLNWAESIVNNSSHAKEGEELRKTMVWDMLLYALVNVKAANEPQFNRFQRQLDDSRDTIVAELKRLLSIFKKESDNYSAGKTPAPLTHIISCLLSYNALFPDHSPFTGEITDLEKEIDSHINFHMGRSGIDGPSVFDPVSLASAVLTKTKISPDFRKDRFFLACIQTIVKFQFANGCWPDGIAITFKDTADVVQQPSVAVAVAVAEAVVDRSFLLDYNENISLLLKTILPGMRNMAKYLADSYQEDTKMQSVTGWSSDRIRRGKYVETWITALVNRFFFRLWMAETALLRLTALQKLGVRYFSSTAGDATKFWKENVIDPDEITQPTKVVWDKYVQPIIKQGNSSVVLKKPESNGVSFVVFGPPGSGKTFFIGNLAKALDWPLVELHPGHFIKNGLELIESTTRDLFDTISKLHHAVVFFDECDELFREREHQHGTTRSILSFATASMLPKLQKLHDERKVIFILGTNFLANIDRAIRRPGRFDDLLLLDRPDKQACIDILRSLDPAREFDEAAVQEDTKFYAFNELKSYSKSWKKLKNTSVDDYTSWCEKNGRDELDNSRYSLTQKKEILERWGIKSNGTK